MHSKKVLSDSKKKQASNLRLLIDFKRKKQECLQVFYSYHETKLFGVYFYLYMIYESIFLKKPLNDTLKKFTRFKNLQSIQKNSDCFKTFFLIINHTLYF
jgi:hypothetical protein